MRVHHGHVGDRLDQDVRRVHVLRPLEEPVVGRRALPLEQLELAIVLAIGPLPGLGREAIAPVLHVPRGRVVREERVAKEHPALDRRLRLDDIDRAQLRDEAVDEPHQPLDLSKVQRLGRREALVDEQRPAPRVLAQEIQQERRAGAAETDDDQRPRHGRRKDLRMLRDLRFDLEPVAQRLREIEAGDQPAQEPGVLRAALLKRADHLTQQRAKPLVAEVREPRAAARGGAQLVLVQRRQRPPDRAQDAAGALHRSHDGGRATSLEPTRGRQRCATGRSRRGR